MSTTDLPPAYDSIKELGVYDSLPNDVKANLPSLVGLPQSVQEKAQAAMTAEAEKDETKTLLLEEVEALADSAVKVDEAFERVRIGLGTVDKNDYKDKKGNPVPKFQPTWVEYQKVITSISIVSNILTHKNPCSVGPPCFGDRAMLQPRPKRTSKVRL
jgi:hypothetical protein